MADQQIDPETLDLEQLRALANEELSATDDAPADDTTPADDAAPAPAAAEEEIVYRREIDLGDGSGVQVFEGDTMEELVDKLASAQENATRKIREQAQQLKERAQAPAPKPEPNKDEEWLMSQELMSSPTKAFEKMFERIVGRPLAQFKSAIERAEAISAAAAEHDASVDFVQAHPEYAATPANARKMVAYMKTYQLTGTVENMEKAYNDLSESGLLEAKKADDATTPAPTKKASGLSSKRSAPAVPAKTEYTEDELYSMDESKLEELARKSSL